MSDAYLIPAFSLLWFLIGIIIGRYMKVAPLLDAILSHRGVNDRAGDRKAGCAETPDEEHQR